MADPFVGEIRMFGGTFAPRSWALCDGQLLPISQNTALFSLLGTIYGGDGQTTFALPDLRGRYAMHAGNGPGLTSRPVGSRSGTETNTLTVNQLPSHNHPTVVSSDPGSSSSPVNGVPAEANEDIYAASGSAAGDPTGSTGGNQSVNNMPPFTAVNFIIALQGLYPSRN